MKKIAECLLGMILTTVFSLAVCSCSDNEETAIDDFDIQFELPSLIEINEGGTYTFILKARMHRSFLMILSWNRKLVFLTYVRL